MGRSHTRIDGGRGVGGGRGRGRGRGRAIRSAASAGEGTEGSKRRRWTQCEVCALVHAGVNVQKKGDLSEQHKSTDPGVVCEWKP